MRTEQEIKNRIEDFSVELSEMKIKTVMGLVASSNNEAELLDETSRSFDKLSMLLSFKYPRDEFERRIKSWEDEELEELIKFLELRD